MLCRTICGKAGLIDLVRCGIVQRLVRSEGIVFRDVAGDCFVQFFGVTIFVDVNQFRFEAAEPALDHDIVHPAGSAVHTLTDVEFLEELLVCITGELAALV